MLSFSIVDIDQCFGGICCRVVQSKRRSVLKLDIFSAFYLSRLKSTCRLEIIYKCHWWNGCREPIKGNTYKYINKYILYICTHTFFHFQAMYCRVDTEKMIQSMLFLGRPVVATVFESSWGKAQKFPIKKVTVQLEYVLCEVFMCTNILS